VLRARGWWAVNVFKIATGMSCSIAMVDATVAGSTWCLPMEHVFVEVDMSGIAAVGAYCCAIPISSFTMVAVRSVLLP